MLSRLLLSAAFGFAGILGAQDIPDELMARFVKTLIAHMGSPNRVACSDATLARELKKLKVSVDSASSVAFSDEENETRTLYREGKLVISSRMELLPKGGSVAIVEEDGKPSIYLHMRHLEETKLPINPGLYKLSSRIVKEAKASKNP